MHVCRPLILPSFRRIVAICTRSCSRAFSVRTGRLRQRTRRAVAAAAVLLVATVALLPNRAESAAIEETEWIEIEPTSREPTRIAIPTFDTAGTSPLALRNNEFHSIIYEDLELTGYFQRPRNQQFVEELRVQDLRNERIDFAEWNRLEPMLFLLVGSYEITGERLDVRCHLYYTPTGKLVFGKLFSNTIRQHRVLAHRISDEVFRYLVAGAKGIANTKILYVSTRDPTRRAREVWVMDFDGANARPLTSDKSLVATPCWGAKATEVYYTSFKDYNPDLCGVYLSGGASWFISRFPRLNISPAWSPERQLIALTLSKDGNSEIYLMSREGTNLKRLTYHRKIDSSPAWSPDGSQIAFTSERDGSPQIRIMDAEGFNDRRISYVNSTYCDSAAWSPKGDKIAFTARVNGQFEIFKCNVDGSQPEQLTGGPGNKEDPSWAPNGLMLVFAWDRYGSTQLYTMNDDGSNVRQLTRGGHNTSPAWSPFLYEERSGE